MSDDTTAKMGHNKKPAEDKLKKNAKLLASTANKIKSYADKINNDKGLATAAGKTRATWAALGRELANAREVISSNKLFNAWLKEAGLDVVIPDRNARTDAMWLANMDDDFLAANVPAQLHNPRNIRRWYRDETDAMLTAMAVNGKVPDGDVSTAVPEQFRAFYDNMEADEFDRARSTFNARVPSVKFNDSSIAEAVDAILRKIAKHNSPVPLATALVDALSTEIERGEDAFKKDTSADDDTDDDDTDDTDDEDDAADEDGDDATDEDDAADEDDEDGDDE